MMHASNELYKINGTKYYTEDYIIQNNIPKAKRYGTEGWNKCMRIPGTQDSFNVHTASGVKVCYTYGEHTWFDTKEERDEYRALRNAQRAEETKRNKMIKAIMERVNTLSTEELEKIISNF